MARIGSRLAGRLVTGPLAFLLATLIDLAAVALRSLKESRRGRRRG